jgi:hypothetical protein
VKVEANMMNLIRSCLGILADLRFEGKGFDVQNNPNLVKLGEMCGRDNSEAFNEVFEKLYSIVNRAK